MTLSSLTYASFTGMEVQQLLYIFEGDNLLGIHRINLQRENGIPRIRADGTPEVLQVTLSLFKIPQYPNQPIWVGVTLPTN